MAEFGKSIVLFMFKFQGGISDRIKMQRFEEAFDIPSNYPVPFLLSPPTHLLNKCIKILFLLKREKKKKQPVPLELKVTAPKPLPVTACNVKQKLVKTLGSNSTCGYNMTTSSP